MLRKVRGEAMFKTVRAAVERNTTWVGSEGLDDSLSQCLKAYPSMKVGSRRIEVVTEKISIDHGGREYGMGSYRIRIDLTDGSLSVRPKRRSGDRFFTENPHPHVVEDYICLGNAIESWRKAYRQGRYADAFDIVVAVLSTYNEDSAFTTIESFIALNQRCRLCGGVPRARMVLCRECASGHGYL